MVKPVLYLAGPMSGCTLEEMSAWRNHAVHLLGSLYEFKNPMHREFVTREYIREQHEQYIVNGDKADIRECDVVLANCWKPSFGTPMEIMMAWRLGKHVVSILPHNVGFSPWITYHSSITVRNFVDATVYLTEYARRDKAC